MSNRCLTGWDDLEMSYQKMSCRCLIEEGLQMSYLKMSYSCLMRDVFKDTLKAFNDFKKKQNIV